MRQGLEPRFRSTDVLRMFPTFVWKAALEPRLFRPINAQILDPQGALAAGLADCRPGESWQSHHRLHEFDPFGPLVACIEAAARDVLAYLEIDRAGIEITGCWANVLAPGAEHRLHSHPNNYLSGVYYVQTQEGANTVNFHDPRPQTGILRPPVSALTAENSDQVVVRVGDGTLLMFPAWLPHSVDPNRSRRARVSISFNIMLTAYAETLSQPGWEEGWRGRRGRGGAGDRAGEA